MKYYLYTSLAAIACVSSVQASPQIDTIKEMDELLKQSITILQSCKDKESTKIATDQLIELRNKFTEIVKQLNQMGPPSPEDMAIMKPLMDSMVPLGKQSLDEVERIKKANLYTPELDAALGNPYHETTPNADKKDEAPTPDTAPAPAPNAK